MVYIWQWIQLLGTHDFQISKVYTNVSYDRCFPHQYHVIQLGSIFCLYNELGAGKLTYLLNSCGYILLANFSLPLCCWLGRRVDGEVVTH